MSSRSMACAIVSPSSRIPPGMDQRPSRGGCALRMRSTRAPETITPPTAITGRSGYSLFSTKHAPAALLLHTDVIYYALCWRLYWEGGCPVVRCPECDAEIDVDEDEVEEGEILTCPECDVELEVLQVHPVHVNVIADEDEDEEEVLAVDDGDDLEEDEEESEEEEPDE